MLFTAQFDDDCLGKLKQIANFEKRTMSSMVRYLVELHYQKIFGLISSIDKNQAEQPAPSAPSAPAARHVPTVEELVADYRADGVMMPKYWRDLTEEERDRVASECHFSEQELECLEGTL